MSNRYNFSDESSKIELPLTSQVESGQIWRNKKSGLKIAIDGPGNGKGVWNAFAVTLGHRIDTQVKEKTLLIDYEREK